MAERATLEVPFEEGAPVGGFSMAGNQSEPAVTADERVAVLLVGESLSYATREHWRAPWGPALLVPGAPLIDGVWSLRSPSRTPPRKLT